MLPTLSVNVKRTDVMAARGDSSDPVEAKPEAVDEKVDFYSDKFDAQVALYAKNVRVPKEDARVYDNLASYTSKTSGAVRTAAVGKAATSKADAKKIKEQEHAAELEKRFLPHQMPIKSTKIAEKNVLTKIAAIEGPLALLKDCMLRKIRVKVITRNEKGIRGYCIGFVQAFDKQWNLGLSDVIEVWTRRRKKKVVPNIEHLSLKECTIRPDILAKVPKVQVTPAGKGAERCEKHVPQLLMRGEHVVLINILEST